MKSLIGILKIVMALPFRSLSSALAEEDLHKINI